MSPKQPPHRKTKARAVPFEAAPVAMELPPLEQLELPTIDRRKTLSARGRAKFWKAFNRFLNA